MDNSQIASGNPELDKKIIEWLSWDQNPKTLDEVKKLVKARNFDELSKILLKRLMFGSSGLRGRMGAGYNAINDLVTIQTSQGLVRYLEELDMPLLKQNGIVIGYDNRHSSKRFADLTATVFLNRSYHVRIFSAPVPTPFVSYSVVKYKCILGIMVTASHNVKEDNGFKVYGSNGCQIPASVDQQIPDYVADNMYPLESSWDTSIVETSDRKVNPMAEVTRSYMDDIKASIVADHKIINDKSNLLFTYTALHGVGYDFVSRALDTAGLKYVPVQEQMNPDPEFPTVPIPNPEEGKLVLDLAIETALANNSNIILSNDPDADRMSAAERNKTTGEWKVFSGNELGALFGWWALHCYQANNCPKPISDVYMLASTVSSNILKTMAKTEGFKFVETLTGYKWIGNKAHEFVMQGKLVLFSFEEANGFMWGSTVLDKDGISSIVHLATMASYLNHHGLTLIDQLEEIYQEYGYHLAVNSYFICEDTEIIKQIFYRLRNYTGDNTYPKGILKGKYTIKNVRDLTTGYDNAQKHNIAVLPVAIDTEMITFIFSNGLTTTLRTSGTEAKLKYYTEMCAKPKRCDRVEIEEIQKAMTTAIIDEFIQPTRYGLVHQTT